jgi:probable addiction module antidote protein
MSRKLKSAVSRSHEEATVESFRKDPAFAAEYLNAVLEDGDQEELMLALRRMSEAFGGVQKLAGRAKLNANTLYRTLSPKGNPELKSLRAVLRAMGMQLKSVCGSASRDSEGNSSRLSHVPIERSKRVNPSTFHCLIRGP